MADFHEIQHGGHAIEGDLDVAFLESYPYLQLFQNDGCSNFWNEYKIEPVKVGPWNFVWR
jgi:hypothetical protein